MKNLFLPLLFGSLPGYTQEEIPDLPDETETSGKTISFYGFTLKAPANWYGFQLQGIDSQVGGVNNTTDTLYFDFGWYSYDFSDLLPNSYIKTNAKINGKEALIGIYTKLAGDDRFNLCGVS